MNDHSNDQYSESVNLIGHLENSSPPLEHNKGSTVFHIPRACLPKYIYLPSKSAIVILIWTLVVGVIYGLMVDGSIVISLGLRYNIHHLTVVVLAAYTGFALVLLLYPLAGYLADVRYGRYKIVIISLCILCCSFALLSIDSGIFVKHNFFDSGPTTEVTAIFATIATASFFLLAIGMAGFQANYIQLGLDQFMDAPSRHLGLFVHWAAWIFALGQFLVNNLFVAIKCNNNNKILKLSVSFIPILIFVTLFLLILLSWYTHRWFLAQPLDNNPYEMVVKVLNYARKHKYPLKRKVLGEDERPTRVDFGKEGYGGPFTTGQVEDVKTFLRILLVLFSLGFVFVLEVATSNFLFPLFALHTSQEDTLNHDGNNCTTRWALLESGTLKNTISILFIPVYIWTVFSLLWKQTPKILNRLQLGIILYLAGAVSMLVIDVVGHVLYNHHTHKYAQCMFGLRFKHQNPHHHHHHYIFSYLGLPWWVLTIPSVLLGLGPLIVKITAFEFISAQSPQPMKGLLMGVFFAIKGLFQLIGAVILIPFSVSPHLDKHNSVISCGSEYFLVIIIIASIGQVFFFVVTKRYKYRQREDPPYSQYTVEKVYHHYVTHTPQVSTRVESTQGQYGSISTSSGYMKI